jgi:hypothetical protein
MAKDWLRSRLEASPAPLRERLESPIANLDTDLDLSEALLEGACELLDRARQRLDLRESAYDLLAADGLLTLACEAAAISQPEKIADRCRDMGPSGRLGNVAARWMETS